jgi:hypothetical protein
MKIFSTICILVMYDKFNLEYYIKISNFNYIYLYRRKISFHHYFSLSILLNTLNTSTYIYNTSLHNTLLRNLHFCSFSSSNKNQKWKMYLEQLECKFKTLNSCNYFPPLRLMVRMQLILVSFF